MICLDIYGCSGVVERRQGPSSLAGGNRGIIPFLLLLSSSLGFFLSFSK